MSRPTSRLRRTALLGVLTTTLAAILLTVSAGASRADPGGPDDATSAVVSRLTLVDGRGWVTVQPRIGAGHVTGFEVDIPAAGGSWGGAADVAVPELGIHCRVGPGPDLRYSCGVTTTPDATLTFLPRGGYQVTLPVTRTGPLSGLGGLAGHASMAALDGTGEVSSYGSDTFPVLDASHYRSSAEVRSAPLSAAPAASTGPTLAILPITMTVVPGETVTALDVPLPSPSLRIIGTNAAGYGITCAVRTSPPGGAGLHCIGQSGAFPAGRYQLVLNLSGDLQESSAGTIALTAAGGTSEVEDSFVWSYPQVS